MFKAHKELLENYEKLQHEVREMIVENKDLRERIRKLERGERCDGKWCDFCENAGGVELVWLGSGIHRHVGGERRVCLLDVPCRDFKRKEENTIACD